MPDSASTSRFSSPTVSMSGAAAGFTTSSGCGSNVTSTLRRSSAAARARESIEHIAMTAVHAVERADGDDGCAHVGRKSGLGACRSRVTHREAPRAAASGRPRARRPRRARRRRRPMRRCDRPPPLTAIRPVPNVERHRRPTASRPAGAAARSMRVARITAPARSVSTRDRVRDVERSASSPSQRRRGARRCRSGARGRARARECTFRRRT